MSTSFPRGPFETSIVGLAPTGEGIGHSPTLETTKVLIPFTLPEEEVLYTVGEQQKNQTPRGHLVQLLKTSPHRQPAPCPYFTTCGGCLLQHMSPSFYKDYKVSLVADAFGRENLPLPPLSAFTLLPPGHRQRTNFKALKRHGEISLGFHAYRSHHIVPVDFCLLLDKRLNDLIQPLKQTLLKSLRNLQEVNVFLTACTNGIDLLCELQWASSPGSEDAFCLTENLLSLCQNTSVIRCILRHDKQERVLYQEAQPFITLDERPLFVPPACFLQTSPQAAHHLISFVSSGLPPKPKRLVDLFSGIGTFTFPMAQRAAVDAYEGSQLAVYSLDQSAKHLQGLHPIRAFHRDLFKNPLSSSELAVYDHAVINPPRAGAVSQMKEMRQSEIQGLTMISCNASTFARDARLLIQSGFSLGSLSLLDQFQWSPHVEIMAHFKR